MLVALQCKPVFVRNPLICLTKGPPVPFPAPPPALCRARLRRPPTETQPWWRGGRRRLSFVTADHLREYFETSGDYALQTLPHLQSPPHTPTPSPSYCMAPPPTRQRRPLCRAIGGHPLLSANKQKTERPEHTSQANVTRFAETLREAQSATPCAQ